MHNLLTSTAILAVLAVAEGAPTASSSSLSASAPTGATYPDGFDMRYSWGNLSPFRSPSGFPLPKGVPRGCELSQTHVLHRHAQRYPTTERLDGEGMELFSQKVAKHSSDGKKEIGSGPLEFLNHWEYLLGEQILLETGAATEDTSGADFWTTHGRLLYRAGANVSKWDESLNVFPNGTARRKPVFRTTSMSRILESARWWLSGFFGDRAATPSYSQYDLVIIPEVDGLVNNDTLATSSCPGDNEEGDKAQEAFMVKFTKDARSRLSKYLPSDFDLTPRDVLSMMNLCPYEYWTLGASSFCNLFTEQEWLDFEFQRGLQFYGNHGFGSPTGRAQGIGYVMELAARLEGKYIHSSDTSVNYTYDDNTAQFPLNQPFYMDMSHDDLIWGVLAALGLDYFKYGPNGLPTTYPPPHQRFKMHEVVPYGARLFSEIWTCPTNTDFDKLDPVLYTNPDLSSRRDTKDYIRLVLNYAPIPLDGNPGCKNAHNGFCEVKDFLKGVPKLNEEAMYQFACFGNYTTDGQVANGNPE